VTLRVAEEKPEAAAQGLALRAHRRRIRQPPRHRAVRGITVLFLAQVSGLHLTILQQFMVLGLCILGGIGTAGIPSGSLPVIAMICGIVGLKPEASPSSWASTPSWTCAGLRSTSPATWPPPVVVLAPGR
jgi:hypothetical protein